jgi:hypothetical protein
MCVGKQRRLRVLPGAPQPLDAASDGPKRMKKPRAKLAAGEGKAPG